MVLVLSQHPCNWARILVRSILFLEIRIVRPLWRRRSFQPKLNPLQSIPITLDSNHPIIPDTAPTISSARRCIFWNPSPPIWQSISNQFYSVGINCFAHNEIEHLSDLFSLFSARFSPSGFRKWLLWHLVQSIPFSSDRKIGLFPKCKFFFTRLTFFRLNQRKSSKKSSFRHVVQSISFFLIRKNGLFPKCKFFAHL